MASKLNHYFEKASGIFIDVAVRILAKCRSLENCIGIWDSWEVTCEFGWFLAIPKVLVSSPLVRQEVIILDVIWGCFHNPFCQGCFCMFLKGFLSSHVHLVKLWWGQSPWCRILEECWNDIIICSDSSKVFRFIFKSNDLTCWMLEFPISWWGRKPQVPRAGEIWIQQVLMRPSAVPAVCWRPETWNKVTSIASEIN